MNIHRTVPIQGKIKEFLILNQVSNGLKYLSVILDTKNTHDYWIAPFSEDTEYSGHNQDLLNVKWCYTFKRRNVNELNIPEKCLINAKLDENDLFRIRLFKFGQRIFL